MSCDPRNEECAVVRDALLSNSFEQISREQVEQHLRTHGACARWAADVLLLGHALALGQGPRETGEATADRQLETYLEGNLDEAGRRHVEDVCCRDLRLAGRLQRLRVRRWQRQVRTLAPAALAQILAAAQPQEDAALVARLDGFQGLYLYRPLAVAAAQTQRSTFQTPDGNFVVSVADRGAAQQGEPHVIELGIRVHQPEWIGRWACYRVLDAQGRLAAAGLLQTEEHGSFVQITLPPTEHAPYTVQAEMLDVETGRLQEVLDQIAGSSNSHRTR
jgi:hypothetical protein